MEKLNFDIFLKKKDKTNVLEALCEVPDGLFVAVLPLDALERVGVVQKVVVGEVVVVEKVGVEKVEVKNVLIKKVVLELVGKEFFPKNTFCSFCYPNYRLQQRWCCKQVQQL